MSRVSATSAVLTLAALLSGCTVGPQHPNTVASLAPPVAFQRLTPASGPAQEVVPGEALRPDWWALFGSAKLDALVTQALAHSEDVAQAEATLRQARETARVTAGAALPQADLNYQAERAKISQELQSPLADQFDTLYTLHTAQLTVSYPLDVFGLQRNRTRSARAQAEIAAERLSAARKTLVANLVTATIQYAALGRQIEASRASIASNRQVLALLQRRQQIGDIGQADVVAQQAANATGEGAVPALVRSQEHERALIAAYLGLAPGATLPELPAMNELALPTRLPVSLPGALVAARPDVRAAAAQMRGAGADVGAAIAARLPQIALSAQGGGISPRLSDILQPGNTFWTLIGGVTQPLFHGGQLKHQQRAAEAALDVAKSQYRAAVILAFADVDDALTGLRTDAEALDAADRASRAAALSLTFGQRQLALGGIGTLALLNATATNAQASATLVQAQAARLVDTVALFQAVGGGVQAQDQPRRD
ncbi:MAG: efflux transporter outer membrane subunit [Janthinobacterium lividum]